ncbi:unnamed protein product [Durusdinium trenchii]|uniref:Pumilio domain member 4 n=1 Tax=Durusdinium trenchii TaxID=1381693 RepID=A0ABP0LRA6_9DINO
MPVSGLVGAAAIAGAANTLWQYNRENYMFDVPLRQGREFQKQNVNLARYALFREDIRDLASLTTDKVSNLLVINTLKVGFIVSVYFNFDRTDAGFEQLTWHDQILSVLLGMTLLTSFFFLMTSIWFAMHALQLAQAITTKLLVQVVRIPMPTEIDIAKAATEAKQFEMNFREALRVPFMSGQPDAQNGQNGQLPHPNSMDDLNHVDDLSVSDLSGLTRLPHRVKTMVKEQMVKDDPLASKPGGPVVTSLNELMYGYENMDKTFSQIEPHLKLLSLVASSWQPFDLYSKVTTVLGSSCLFSGLAYYSIFYYKPSGTSEVTPEAWCCFLFMCTLAWWNLTIEIAGSSFDLALAAIFMMVGPFVWMFTDKPSLTDNRMQMFGCPLLIFLPAVWISYLGIRACTIAGVWPHFFTSTRYLNVLHKQKGPIEIPRDIARKAKGEDNWSMDDNASTDSGEIEDVNRAMAMAQPLVDALSCIALQPQSSASRQTVSQARDTLREAARAAGVSRSTVLLKGFFIHLEMNGDQEEEVHWVDPCGISSEPEHLTAPDTVSLVEIIETSNQVADMLLSHAVRWTVDDMVNLASYGGEPVAGVHSFLFQFENTLEKSTHFRPSADYLFKVAMALVSIFWILVLCWSLRFSTNVFSRISLQGGDMVSWTMPQPWRMVESFGCTLEGTHYVMTDGYTVQVLNSDGSLYLHFQACGDQRVSAVDFGQGGEIIACCETGTQSTWVANGKVMSQHWVSNISGLMDVAVDRSPLEDPDHIDAIAVRDNQLLGFVFEPNGRWRLFGRLTLPENRDRQTDEWSITALAIRLGRALILTKGDQLFELDVPSGQWTGPLLLPTLGPKSKYDWISVCRLSRGRWKMVGLPSKAPIQLWDFERPPINTLPPRRDETNPQLALSA